MIILDSIEAKIIIELTPNLNRYFLEVLYIVYIYETSSLLQYYISTSLPCKPVISTKILFYPGASADSDMQNLLRWSVEPILKNLIGSTLNFSKCCMSESALEEKMKHILNEN